jgi:hypothetical protein
MAVDVLLKAYPIVPLSCRSNLARRYLQHNARIATSLSTLECVVINESNFLIEKKFNRSNAVLLYVTRSDLQKFRYISIYMHLLLINPEA